MIGTGGGFHLCFKFSSPLLGSEAVFVKRGELSDEKYKYTYKIETTS